MAATADPASLLQQPAYIVGIKGSGTAALAELLTQLGVSVSGSDTAEEFFTDAMLQRAGIPVREGFAEENLPAEAETVIYSAAYDPNTHPELLAARRRGLPLLSYTEALGAFSAGLPSIAIAGVHGKTTTTALAATLLRETGLPGAALVGSSVPSLGDRAVHVGGNRFFVAETCEYKRHFLSFHPRIVVITSVEPDHLDYYRDYEDIRDAFLELVARLPQRGILLYCADDPGARDVAERSGARRADLRIIGYGERAAGAYAVRSVEQDAGVLRFSVGIERSGSRVDDAGGRSAGESARALEGGAADEGEAASLQLRLSVPGRHNALNAAAALAAIELAAEEFGLAARGEVRDRAPAAFELFRGSARRSELVGEAGGITIIDDYGHHPTAIRTTIAGLRAFYPGRRIVVDFMSHTYTRTAALLDEFATALQEADAVLLHKIYASAREQYTGSVGGTDLFERVAEKHPGPVRYSDEVLDALPICRSLLEPGDVFVTMGAGDNWRLGRAVLEELSYKRSTR